MVEYVKNHFEQSEEKNNMATNQRIPPIGIWAILEYPTLAVSHFFHGESPWKIMALGGWIVVPLWFPCLTKGNKRTNYEVLTTCLHMLLIWFDFVSLDVWIHIPPPIKTKTYVDATVHKDYMLAPDSNPRWKEYSNHFKHELQKKQPKVANMFQDNTLRWIHIQYVNAFLCSLLWIMCQYPCQTKTHIHLGSMKTNTWPIDHVSHMLTQRGLWANQMIGHCLGCDINGKGPKAPAPNATALVQKIRGVLKGSLTTIKLCLGLSSAFFLGGEWHCGITFGFSWHRFWCHQ